MKNVKLDIQRFSHTNSTSNYEFPQFVGTDKPAWLTDVNGFASAADTAIKAAKDRADAAYTLAGTAEGKADLAQGDATSALNSAGTANTNIGTMADLNTTDKTSLVGAINEVNNNLNFTSFKEYNTSSADFVKGNNITLDGLVVNLAKTQNGSYAKVYGQFLGYPTTSDSGNTEFILNNTGLTISEAFTVRSVGITTRTQNLNGTDVVTYVARCDLLFNTNGSITIKSNQTWETGKYYNVILHPVVIQVKSFGDQPE